MKGMPASDLYADMAAVYASDMIFLAFSRFSALARFTATRKAAFDFLSFASNNRFSMLISASVSSRDPWPRSAASFSEISARRAAPCSAISVIAASYSSCAILPASSLSLSISSWVVSLRSSASISVSFIDMIISSVF